MRQERLPGDVRVELVLAQARLSNRSIRLAGTFAGPPCRLVMTVRAPLLGERWTTVPSRRHN